MRALIVDDCIITRELLSVPVSAHGIVDQSDNGEEASKMVKTAIDAGEPYDLICLDINMPLVDGHETLRNIRKIESESGEVARATIFMITASSSPDDMMEALLSGSCDDYLTKPVMSKTLTALMKKHGLIS